MKRKFNSVSSDDESDIPGLNFDPSTLFSSLAKKDNDIKVIGNKIYFYKTINKDNILNLIEVLNNTIRKIKNNEYSNTEIPIYLFINSEGGDYFAGISGFDQIKNIEYPIYTVIDGMVASAATFLALAGRKRFVCRSAWVLIHQIKTWLGGMYTFEQLKDDLNKLKKD